MLGGYLLTVTPVTLYNAEPLQPEFLASKTSLHSGLRFYRYQDVHPECAHELGPVLSSGTGWGSTTVPPHQPLCTPNPFHDEVKTIRHRPIIYWGTIYDLHICSGLLQGWILVLGRPEISQGP